MNGRVLILYSGGTIGMVSANGVYVPGPDFRARLTRRLEEQQRELPQFDVVELDRLIDSANLTPENWTTMARVLAEHWDRYDGFVVIHGTDTMAFTASALSYMLQGCDKPVILTGSQIPLEQSRTDALQNVINALVLASTPGISEVCLYFCGNLLRGNRARKLKTNDLEAFDSPNAPRLGRSGIDLELRHDLLLPPGKPNFQIPAFNSRSVATLTFYPGIPAILVESILALPDLKGLIIHTYGSGNAPDEDKHLVQALADGVRRGVSVLNISQCLEGRVAQKAYASGAALDRVGVIAGGNLTPEAAFAKLHFLLATGHSPDSLHAALQTPLCGDSDPAAS
ncbi:type I asparaginase [Marinobacter adhaerens]|jgi:L-asparaginase|uniref:type I asparaginase n=1 Tax=Marinobacter adhaerens TaxID=1033846 RepID=UPI001E30D621|nr:type I asparaginase [Marinobacter adhaerens]MCD1649277.1 type I asparaginase [Marinobacter adhaerens]